ncbi:MAG TPA: VOC family protein [Allosphingosinicella sp.]|nr:VOC family protein [Allosphingosinicella sp.]
MPLSPSHISQIGIHVTDLDRAKAFYGESLGLAHLFDAPPRLAFYQCGETRLMLAESRQLAGEGGAILYYAVDDARDAQAALAAAGATFDADARVIARVGDKDIWLAVTSDGAGNPVGLMSEQAAG